MRSVPIAIALALLASPAQAAELEHYRVRTAGDLVRICSTPPSQSDYATAIAFCHGILAGAYGYYDASTPAADRFVCLPDPPPARSKVARDFVAWAKSHPQFMPNHPIDTLFRYAGQAFPCRK